MEKGILIGFGIIFGYILFRYFRRYKKEVDLNEILNNDKYKAKGQWDK